MKRSSSGIFPDWLAFPAQILDNSMAFCRREAPGPALGKRQAATSASCHPKGDGMKMEVLQGEADTLKILEIGRNTGSR